MSKWIEYHDAYVVQTETGKYASQKNIFEVNDVFPGVSMAFIDKERRNGSFKLAEIIFDKNQHSLEDAMDFWTDFEIRCLIKSKNINKMLPSIEFATESDNGLIIIGYYRNIIEFEPKKSLKKQLEEMEKDT